MLFLPRLLTIDCCFCHSHKRSPFQKTWTNILPFQVDEETDHCCHLPAIYDYMTHYCMSMLKQFILEPYWVVMLESLLQLRDSNSQGCSAWKMQRDQYVWFLCFKCRFDYSFHTRTQSTETHSGCLNDIKNIFLIHHNTNFSFLLESKLMSLIKC